MWTETTRPRYERKGLRFVSDLTDAEWGVICPLLPPRKRLGCPRTTAMREVVNAILYMARTGCQWRMLPKDFPPKSTVQEYFYAWRAVAARLDPMGIPLAAQCPLMAISGHSPTQ